jgi:hypothetical protein
VNAGTEDSANTEALGELVVEAVDEVEGVETTLSTNGVLGTALGEIVETEAASNMKEFEVLRRANKAFCLTSKSFRNSTLSPPVLAEDSGT